MICHKYKFIFVHIPKTAGTSIGNALTTVMPRFGYGSITPAGTDKHQHVLDLIGLQKSEDYFKFAFVRNPWDRHVSNYFHQRKKNTSFFKGLIFKDYTIWSPAWRAEMKRKGDLLIARERKGKRIFQGLGGFDVSKQFKYSGRLGGVTEGKKIIPSEQLDNR